jgi:thiol-disulfide isomerase/thioredoxin
MRLPLFLIAGLVFLTGGANAQTPDLYLVSFTAEWCPNCKILDPKMEAALEAFDEKEVEHVVLDMTDNEASLASFETVDGTILAGVYGDHLGVTGIGIMTAPDSGEKIGCLTREHSVAEITDLLRQAREIAMTQPPGTRDSDLGSCPEANTKIAL